MLGTNIERDSWIYAYAAHLYYHGNGDSILLDSEYDALTDILCYNWWEIPKELREIFGSPEEIQTTGMHIKLNTDQMATSVRHYNAFYSPQDGRGCV